MDGQTPDPQRHTLRRTVGLCICRMLPDFFSGFAHGAGKLEKAETFYNAGENTRNRKFIRV